MSGPDQSKAFQFMPAKDAWAEVARAEVARLLVLRTERHPNPTQPTEPTPLQRARCCWLAKELGR